MGFSHFTIGMILRLAFLLMGLLVISFSIAGLLPLLFAIPGSGLALFMLWSLIRQIRQTNEALARFLESVRHADFTQGFMMPQKDAGFAELGAAMTALIRHFKSSRAVQEQDIRTLRAIIDHVPAPLLKLRPDGSLILLNHAARRLFAPQSPVKLSDLAHFGPDLPGIFTDIAPGENRLLSVRLSDGTVRLGLSAAEIISGQARQRIYALQNLSGALEATEIEAWQQLVQVLTHEIMNSLTPVASLSKTASDLLARAETDPEAVLDAREAVETVARRAGTLMQFVGSYRSLTRLAKPKLESIALLDFLDHLERLVAAELEQQQIHLHCSVSPPTLSLLAYRAQLEQMLINLLRNAMEALSETKAPTIHITARIGVRGRVLITVRDNGPGIGDEISDRIFVPFFTTKRGGSGIGLALARQIMAGHKGSIALEQGTNGGAAFTLRF
ncbi:ATP-binding protein [Iodidimonas sp. MBR-14]|jgi:signal transduction histidine kinase|nr:ATP-binding protein [Iodidimonas sp. MBR-14]